MTPTLAQITKELLASYNRFPRKHLGQHFLVDPQVLTRIINAAELTKDDLVLEIGSGLGVVTSEIAPKVYHLIAIEVDKELLKISKDVLKSFQNITFVPKDILKTRLNELTLGRKYKIIGNLPYYITAPIIQKILEAKDKAELTVLMVQKEVAERMAASPGSKKYGSFSIFVQFHAEVKLNSFVSKSSFHPWPEVGSAVVVLKPYQEPKYQVKNKKLFFDIMHAAFQQRRKQLRNSLKDYNLAGLDIDLSRRPETLSIEEFAALSNHCYNSKS
ncbi:MAG: 16S rRNA (adenine(1518)-N(6)/adenine(1519)-N(6))-dimethyltransferase RsmA [Candidatus Margulisiibacteriota bacterium]